LLVEALLVLLRRGGAGLVKNLVDLRVRVVPGERIPGPGAVVPGVDRGVDRGPAKEAVHVELRLALDVGDELVPRHSLQVDPHPERLGHLADRDSDPLPGRPPGRNEELQVDFVWVPRLGPQPPAVLQVWFTARTASVEYR